MSSDWNARKTSQDGTRFPIDSGTETTLLIVGNTESACLGSPLADQRKMQGQTKIEYKDNADRIAVERTFVLAKQKRDNRKIRIIYTIPDDGCNLYTGMLFLIPGYGGNLDSNVYRHLREDFSDKYNLIVVQCEYFGSAFMQDETPDIVEKLDRNEHIEAMDIKWKITL